MNDERDPAGETWEDIPTEVREAVDDGIVPIRMLTHHTSHVLRAITTRGRPVAVTRHGKVVVAITPTSTRELLNQVIAQSDGLRETLAATAKEAPGGDLRRATDVIAADDLTNTHVR